MRHLLTIMLCAGLVIGCGARNTNLKTPDVPKTEPPISVAVYPKFALSRTGVRITIRMAESVDNRALKVSLDGPFLYRSTSEEWTDGRFFSPRIKMVAWDNVPEGQYVVTGILVRANGRTYQAYDTFCVAGINTTCGQESVERK